MGSALVTAVQATPAAAIAPASAAARALHCALLGVRNRFVLHVNMKYRLYLLSDGLAWMEKGTLPGLGVHGFEPE